MQTIADPFADAGIRRPARCELDTSDQVTAKAEHEARLRRRRLAAYQATGTSTRVLMHKAGCTCIACQTED